MLPCNRYSAQQEPNVEKQNNCSRIPITCYAAFQDAQKWAEENSEKIEMLQNLRTGQEIEIGELKQVLLKLVFCTAGFQLFRFSLNGCGTMVP